MTGTQFEQLDFLLIPLTPIHIGGGDTASLGRENYRVNGTSLERVNLRKLLLREINSGRNPGILRGAFQEQVFNNLRERAHKEDIEETIELSEETAHELTKTKGRQGVVNAFQRSGDAPVLPGTSLKGVLRTSCLAHFAEDLHNVGPPPSKIQNKELNQKAFRLNKPNDTDGDPMRDMTVSDIRVPEKATRVDQVHTWKRKEGQYSFDTTGQMHWERLRCVADGGTPMMLKVKIGLRSKGIQDERRSKDASKVPQTSDLSFPTLLKAAEAQHRPVWERDISKFFEGENNKRLNMVLKCISHLNLSGPDPDGALIRIGRGSHAEVKSVEKFRSIHRPQAKGAGKYAKEGNTRHVIKIGGVPITFGWALLVRVDRWSPPPNWLTASSAVRPGSSKTMRFRKGDRVIVSGEEAILYEDLIEGMREVNVDFDGDIEPVDPLDIEGFNQ